MHFSLELFLTPHTVRRDPISKREKKTKPAGSQGCFQHVTGSNMPSWDYASDQDHTLQWEWAIHLQEAVTVPVGKDPSKIKLPNRLPILTIHQSQLWKETWFPPGERSINLERACKLISLAIVWELDCTPESNAESTVPFSSIQAKESLTPSVLPAVCYHCNVLLQVRKTVPGKRLCGQGRNQTHRLAQTSAKFISNT
jgi:hypothetical protein